MIEAEIACRGVIERIRPKSASSFIKLPRRQRRHYNLTLERPIPMKLCADCDPMTKWGKRDPAFILDEFSNNPLYGVSLQVHQSRHKVAINLPTGINRKINLTLSVLYSFNKFFRHFLAMHPFNFKLCILHSIHVSTAAYFSFTFIPHCWNLA